MWSRSRRLLSIATSVAMVVLGSGCGVTGSPTVMTNASVPKNPHVTLQTNLGAIELELFAADSPKTVENFLTLASKGFYDGTSFHRVIAGFMIQGGDPLTKERPKDLAAHGTGGPGYTFADEFNAHSLVRGSLAMANAGANTNGSQFFIVTAAATPWLDGKHTNFGKVVEGMDVVDRIEHVPVDSRDHPRDGVMVQQVVVRP